MSDMAELFQRDPLELTNQDIDLIIQRYRDARHAFAAGAKTAGKPEAKKSAAQKKGELALKAVGNLDLDSLL